MVRGATVTTVFPAAAVIMMTAATTTFTSARRLGSARYAVSMITIAGTPIRPSYPQVGSTYAGHLTADCDGWYFSVCIL